MPIKSIALYILPLLSAAFLCCSFACALPLPIDNWKALIVDGSSQKFEGHYDKAAQSFVKAVTLADNEKLPSKCLPISLCRLAEMEVLTNKISEADIHFKRIIELIKQQKQANTLDPQVNFWAAVLADAYQNNQKPETREVCLRRACYLKDVVYGGKHKECRDCVYRLAEYYIENNQVDKGIHYLHFATDLMDRRSTQCSDSFADMLDQLAVKCRTEHKYKQAEQLELVVIKTAKAKNSTLTSRLPMFYSFLGMNALAQQNAAQANFYFSMAIKEVSKGRTEKERTSTSSFLGRLNQFIVADTKDKKFALAEAEAKHLLEVYKSAKSVPLWQYGTISLLVTVLEKEGKLDEAIKYLAQDISMAQPKNCYVHGDLPDLYTRKAIIQASINPQEIAEANKTFVQAINAERDKTGPHGTLTLFWWGHCLSENGQYPLAIEKLSLAYKQANALPPQKRGTLLADVLQMAAITNGRIGRNRLAQQLFKQAALELERQKKINPNLSPNVFNRS